MGESLLTLMRHAKSSWQSAGQADHDRPLNERGKRDAPMMAQRLIEKRCVPDLIVCSSAQRARQTGAFLMSAFQLADDQFESDPELYLASPETIRSILQNIEPSIRHVLIIAHNPGLAELSVMLAPESSPHLPTAGIRHFSWPDANSDQNAVLLFEDYPKNLINQ